MVSSINVAYVAVGGEVKAGEFGKACLGSTKNGWKTEEVSKTSGCEAKAIMQFRESSNPMLSFLPPIQQCENGYPCTLCAGGGAIAKVSSA